jgi:hypothetical protein
VSQFAPLPAPQLPEITRKIIDEFLEAARTAFGENLRSVVLHGSAAEGALRPTSDLNLILVLDAFDPSQAERIRPSMRLAQSTIQLNAMFLLSNELPAAMRSFAPKFADVLRRRVVLFGVDPFAELTIPRDAELQQLRQQLLNITLRMRAVFTARGAREEQLAIFLARAIGPIRKLTDSFLRLENMPAISPQEALQKIGSELGVTDWSKVVDELDKIQTAQIGSNGLATQAFLKVLECVEKMRTKAETIGGEIRHESI